MILVLLLVVHVFVAVSLVGVILLQKSEGGALGMGGGGMSGFMTGRSTANLLTRTTAILAACFMATSVLLVVLSNRHEAPRSIIEGAPEPSRPIGPAPPLVPGPAPAPSGSAAPGEPSPPASAPGVPTPSATLPTAPTESAPPPTAPAEPSPPLAR
jgi:preprotein translocase subunit SecG